VLLRVPKREENQEPDYLRLSINGGTPKWMVYEGKSIYKWMIWGYPHFRKLPYIYNTKLMLSYVLL
jgi:hypothetical protein